MISLITLSADEFNTLMSQRYPNWESLLQVKLINNYVKIHLLVHLLNISIDVEDIRNNTYHSRRFKKIWKHIVENEDKLILWRLL